MKKILVLALVATATFAFKSDSIDTVNELINTHNKAVGSSKLNGLKGIKIKGVFNLGTSDIPIVIYTYKGNFRLEYYYEEKSPAVSVYTHDKAWKTSPWDLKTVVELKGEELNSLKEQAQLLGILYNYEALGFTEATLVPETDPKASNQIVTLKRPDDATYSIYVSKANHLITQMDKTKFTAGRYQTQSIYYENYKNFKGIELPMLLREEAFGKPLSSFRYTDVETGLKLNKNLFTKP